MYEGWVEQIYANNSHKHKSGKIDAKQIAKELMDEIKSEETAYAKQLMDRIRSAGLAKAKARIRSTINEDALKKQVHDEMYEEILTSLKASLEPQIIQQLCSDDAIRKQAKQEILEKESNSSFMSGVQASVICTMILTTISVYFATNFNVLACLASGLILGAVNLILCACMLEMRK